MRPGKWRTLSSGVLVPSAGGGTGPVAVGAAGFSAAASQFLSRADPAALEPGAGNFSLAAWVNLASKPAGAVMVASKSTAAGNQREYFIDYTGSASDRFAFGLSMNGAGFAGVGVGQIVTANNFGAPATGTWYLVAATYDQVTAAISVNAGTQDTAAAAGPLFAGTADFEVGTINAGTGSFWDGAIARLAYWNRALSTTDITNLYHGGASYQFANLPAGLAAGLVSWWDLGDAAGGNRLDSVGGLTLTDHNAVGLVTGPP